MANVTKISPEKWIEAARQALIADGAAGVKVDRLAKSLGVTRGGFYHHFENQQDLIDRLVQHWVDTNDMLPAVDGVSSRADALRIFDDLIERVVLEEAFSPSFDLAIREWARIDDRIKKTVDKVDGGRIRRLTKLFLALGCGEEEAAIRARVFYFHQIGFYMMGYHTRQSRSKRLAAAPAYMSILCGERYTDPAGRKSRQRA